MNENKVIRQISDYSLEDLNNHIKIINEIPDYIMDCSRRNYWINQITMRKNIILDDIEQQTCLFDRHTKVKKWLDKKLNCKLIGDTIYVGNKPMTFHEFYFENREEIESYFLNMIEKPSTVTISNNDENDKINLDADMQKLLEE